MTYRVLIADDEQLEREALAEIIATRAPGEPEIVLAANGREARELIARQRVDLALLDIRMPGGSGLEVAAELRAAAAPEPSATRPTRDRGPDLVFVSAYDYFEYAQQAIRLRARDYLIKPVDDEAIVRLLEQWYADRMAQSSLEALDEGEAGVGTAVVSTAAFRYASDSSEAPAPTGAFGEVARFIEEELLRDLLAGTLPRSALERGMRLVNARRAPMQALVLRTLEPPDPDSAQGLGRRARIEAALQDATRRWAGDYRPERILRYAGIDMALAIAVGATGAAETPVFEEQGVRWAMTAALRDAGELMTEIGELRSRLWSRELPGAEAVATRRRIVDAVSAGDRDTVEQEARAYWHRAGEGSDRSAALSSLLTLVRGVLELREQVDPDQPAPRPGLFSSPVTSAEDLTTRLLALIPDREPADPRAREIRTWLENNFHRPVGLADLARSLGLSESHCSRACTRLLGQPFGALLRQRRLEEARQLLSSTNLRIHVIAARCGFADAPYLARVFREESGLSPREWRRRYA